MGSASKNPIKQRSQIGGQYEFPRRAAQFPKRRAVRAPNLLRRTAKARGKATTLIDLLQWNASNWQGKMKNEISNDQKTYLIKEFLLIQLLRPKILTFLSDWLFKQIKQFWPSARKNLRARFASGATMLFLSLSPVRSCTPLLVLPARTSVKGLLTWQSLGLAVAGENPWPLCND